MSTAYTWVGWNRQKRLYDAVMVACIAAFLATFVGVSFAAFPAGRAPGGVETLIRALGVCAIVMLHVVLWIGPLARFHRRFLPLLYNRRHLGVATFLVGATHAALVLVWYHGFGNVSPFISLLASNTAYGSLTAFPFEALGVAALTILFLMAATSHDFWLKNLAAPVWKALHMLVYVAYGLLVAHVALGALQQERSAAYVVLAGAGLGVTIALHVAAGIVEVRRDRAGGAHRAREHGEFVDVCSVDEIDENRAKVVCPGRTVAEGLRERVAIFRSGGALSAVSNVCEHQGGPLGEGKIIDGCITCPWHGYQYRPGDGCAPAPFTERINTYRVRISAGRVLLDPRPVGRGVPVEPTVIGGAGIAAGEERA